MIKHEPIANTEEYTTGTIMINKANISSRASRACILCNDSTGSMHKYLCDDCRKLWMLLKDIAKEDGMQ